MQAQIMQETIVSGTIINEGKRFRGAVVIEGERIKRVENLGAPVADDPLVIPGVIDDHVHFREPGLTAKADIESETRAAAAGGVTTCFDMPNTVPQTTSLAALEEKFALASTKSHVNYSFFFGATNTNIHELSQLDIHRIPGVKLFMGSSTGNMLVDSDDALEQLFRESPLPIMAHCEDTALINRNMAEAKSRYGDDPDISQHPLIRSAEACYESTRRAVELARKTGARLHVAHLTTARELELFVSGDPLITAEAVIAHLFFSDADYGRLGALIKVNPAVKTLADRDALRRALNDGRIAVVGTDHAPHLLSQKQGGCATAASGMPMIQFSLPVMMELADEGVLSHERMVELMCHRPATLFGVTGRGFLRPGYQADVVVLRHAPWQVSAARIESKCGWSPLEGHRFGWQVEHTFCNGHPVYRHGRVDTAYIGQPVRFRQ